MSIFLEEKKLTNKQLYALMISVIANQLDKADELYKKHAQCYDIVPYLNHLYYLMDNVRYLTEKPNFDDVENEMNNLKLASAAVFMWLGLQQYINDVYFKNKTTYIESTLLNALINKKSYNLDENNFHEGIKFYIEPNFKNENNFFPFFESKNCNLVRLFSELNTNHPDFYNSIEKVIYETFNMYSNNIKLYFYDLYNFKWILLICEISENQDFLMKKENKSTFEDKDDLMKKEKLLILIEEKKEKIKVMKKEFINKEIIKTEHDALLELIKKMNTNN
jgi:hypothetical protein